MSLTALFFIIVFLLFTFLSVFKGPFWGVLLYIHIYFNMPSHQFWSAEVPDTRWSFISLIVVLLSCFLHKEQLSTRKLFNSIITKEFVVYAILVFITAHFSDFPAATSEKVHFYLGYILIYFILLKVIRTFNELTIVMGWILLEVFQLSRLAHSHFHGGRLEGVGLPDASSANLFGGFIALVLPFFLPFLFSQNIKIRLLAVALSPLVVNSFIMCGSRGAFLGVFVSTIVSIVFVYFQKSKRVNKKTIFFCVSLAVVGFLMLLSQDYKERLFSLTDDTTEDVSSGRTEIWSHGIRMVYDHPFGAGPAGFMELSPYYIPQEYIQKGVGQRAAHNTYLLVLVEQGYIGLFVFLSMIFSVFWYFRKSWRLLMNEDRNFFSGGGSLISVEYIHLALLASFVSFVVTIFFASRLYFEFFYILLALIVLFFQLVQENYSDGFSL